jgi:hypothetical protein
MARPIPYEENHREINGLLEKKCNKHYIYFPDEHPWFPCTEEYYYKNKLNKLDGLQPHCKKCGIEKGTIFYKSNIESEKKRMKEHCDKNKEHLKIIKKKNFDDNPELYKLNRKLWRQNHPEKLKIYNSLHREHDITKNEEISLLRVFNHSCAYCGMTEKEHKLKFNQKLHNDHVNTEGYNDLRNDVPACKGCNCGKWEHPMEEWYREQKFFSEERLKFINWWTNEGYKDYIEDKPPYKIVKKRNEHNRKFHHELWSVDECRNMIECIAFTDKKKDLKVFIDEYF